MLKPIEMIRHHPHRKSECFFAHTCFERYTAEKVAKFLRAGQKQGGYFVRVQARRRSFRLMRRPEYYWVVRVYRKIDVDIVSGSAYI